MENLSEWLLFSSGICQGSYHRGWKETIIMGWLICRNMKWKCDMSTHTHTHTHSHTHTLTPPPPPPPTHTPLHSNSESYVFRLASPVISASFQCDTCSTSNLSTPVQVTFKHTQYDQVHETCNKYILHV